MADKAALKAAHDEIQAGRDALDFSATAEPQGKEPSKTAVKAAENEIAAGRAGLDVTFVAPDTHSLLPTPPEHAPGTDEEAKS